MYVMVQTETLQCVNEIAVVVVVAVVVVNF
jgi:hypothetical protein